MSQIMTHKKLTKEEEIEDEQKYLHLLPSNEDLIDYIKYSITTCIAQKDENLITDKFGASFDMYMVGDIYNTPTTDIELLNSIMRIIRMYLVPKQDGLPSFTQNDNPAFHFRFWYGNKIVHGTWSTAYPCDYNLMNDEFIQWLRGVFNSPKAECVADKTVLKEIMEKTIGSMLWYGKMNIICLNVLILLKIIKSLNLI